MADMWLVNKFDSEEELIAHNENAHMTNLTALRSPEKERVLSTLGQLQLSPILGQRGEVKVSAPEPFSSGAAASAMTSTPSSTVPLSFGRDVGTQMCPVCDFDMCFPILDSIDISCGCSLGEDS